MAKSKILASFDQKGGLFNENAVLPRTINQEQKLLADLDEI
ncbi:unnamed protein product, partial [marine sediment metagenome]